MPVKYYCDRCGNECFRRHEIESKYYIGYSMDRRRDAIEFDNWLNAILCEYCLIELKEFLKRKND